MTPAKCDPTRLRAAQHVANKNDLHDDAKKVGNGASAQKFYHDRDHRKSVRIVTDTTGAEVTRTTYAPCGRVEFG